MGEGEAMKAGRMRPSPAMIVAVIALIVSVVGTAWAKLPNHSVGSRQLKAKSVTNTKIADGAVNSTKVANDSLTGEDINLGELGTVPSASNVTHAGNADTVSGQNHAASCPQGMILIRGTCFDTSSSGPVVGVAAAADACAARGGYLPSPMALYSVRGVIDLGNGSGTDSQYSDSINYDTNGVKPTIIVVNETGLQRDYIEDPEPPHELANYEYICAYPLVR
jgi:hypothetical protein